MSKEFFQGVANVIESIFSPPALAAPLPASSPTPIPRPSADTPPDSASDPIKEAEAAADEMGSDTAPDDYCEKCVQCELVTAEMLKKIFSGAPMDRLKIIADGVNFNINKGKLDGEYRLTHFFGQVREEIGPKAAFRESLYYRPEKLIEYFSAFKKHPELAQKYGYIPQKQSANEEAIANLAYDDQYRSARHKLGNTQPGDGWRYRGRGLKQLTGRDNYRSFTVAHEKIWGEKVDFEANPDLVDQPIYAVRSGLYFWVIHKLYEKADGGISPSITDSITKVINESTSSYGNRRQHVEKIYSQRLFKPVCFNTTSDLSNKKAEAPK